MVGHLSARDSMKGTLSEGSFTENPKDEDFQRYAKCPVNGPLSLQGPCWETWRRFVCQDF